MVRIMLSTERREIHDAANFVGGVRFRQDLQQSPPPVASHKALKSAPWLLFPRYTPSAFNASATAGRAAT